MKRWIIVATILIAAAAVLFVTRQNKLRAEQTPQTVTVTRGTIVQEALALGNIVPEQEVSVKSKLAGIVAEVHVAVGDRAQGRAADRHPSRPDAARAGRGASATCRSRA